MIIRLIILKNLLNNLIIMTSINIISFYKNFRLKEKNLKLIKLDKLLN